MEKLDNHKEGKEVNINWLLESIKSILSDAPSDVDKKEYLMEKMVGDYGEKLAKMIIENLPEELFEIKEENTGQEKTGKNKLENNKEIFETFKKFYKKTLEEQIQEIEKLDKISKIESIDMYQIFPYDRNNVSDTYCFSIIKYKDEKITINDEGPNVREYGKEDNQNRKLLKELSPSYNKKEEIMRIIQENLTFSPNNDEIIFNPQVNKQKRMNELKEKYDEVLIDVDIFENEKEDQKGERIEFENKELREYGEKLSHLYDKLISASKFLMDGIEKISIDKHMIDAYKEFIEIYNDNNGEVTEIEPIVEKASELILTKIEAENLSKGVMYFKDPNKKEEFMNHGQWEFRKDTFLKKIHRYKNLDYLFVRLQTLKHLDKIANNKSNIVEKLKDDIDTHINDIRESFLSIDLKIEYMEIFESTKDYDHFRLNDPTDFQKKYLGRINFEKENAIKMIMSFGYKDITEKEDYRLNVTDKQTRIIA